MHIREALQSGLKILLAHDISSPQLAAELLMMHALGCDRSFLYSHAENELPAALVDRYLGTIAERSTGKPTQYITGHQEFWGLDFEVTPDVLIPRAETEHIVEAVISEAWNDSAASTARSRGHARENERGLRIIDVGTGSGCIALALASELPHATIIATDISAAALAVASCNTARFGFQRRVHFLQADLLEPFLGASCPRWLVASTGEAPGRKPGYATGSLPFDFVVSNPPYVGLEELDSVQREVREFEPRLAWGGLAPANAVYRRLIPQAFDLLVPGGYLVLEIGYNMAQRVQQFFESGWKRVEVRPDLAGIPRVILAQKAD